MNARLTKSSCYTRLTVRMTDNLTRTRRSWNMSRIRSKDTQPELIVRSILHRLGYRFSLQCKDLPGRPDIVFPKYRVVLYVHGCFWHAHRGCRSFVIPKTRRTFWMRKFRDNVARDRLNVSRCRKQGWRVLTVWECQIERNPIGVLKRVCVFLDGTDKRVRSFVVPAKTTLVALARKKAAYNLPR